MVDQIASSFPAAPLFRYLPLEPQSQDIRLLALEPGRWDSHIKCRLTTVSLEDRPHFEALSYVWGEKTPQGQIELEGCLHLVTTNLEAALRHLRYESETRILWVDAICINQVDISERSEQVQKMHSIYTQAASVLAWTGVGSEGSAETIDLIRDIGNVFLENSIFGRNELGQDRVELPSNRLRRLGLSLKSVNWQALWEFLERPYWSRIWVIQELAVRGYVDDPLPCTVYCGASQVDLLNLIATGLFLLYYGVYGRVSDPVSGKFDPIYSPLLPRARKHPPALSMCQVMMPDIYHQDSTLVQLVQICRKFYATDPRDKVYALLGLTSLADRAFRPDYSKPVQAVLMEYVKFFVRRDRNLHSIFSNRREACSMGPSWLPEVHPEHQSLNDSLIVADFMVHNAGGGRKAEVEFDDHIESMIVKGVVIGTIGRVIGPWHDYTPTVNSNTTVKEFDTMTYGQDASRQIQALARELHNKSRYDDFWRTLTLNKLQNLEQGEDVTYPAPEELAYMSRVNFKLEPPPPDFRPDIPQRFRPGLYAMTFWKSFIANITERTLFATETGQIGLGPYLAAPGDVAVVLYGSEYPFVLRPDGEEYRVMGTAYVHGVMDGELVREGSRAEEMVFTLC